MGSGNKTEVGTTFIRVGAGLAFVGVALGAFGAHLLQEQLHLEAHWLDVWRTGVQYHLIHAVALLLIGLLAERRADIGALIWVGRLFTAGIVLFGGSLYALALSSLSPGGPVKILGAITPLGGVCFLVGWAILCVAVRRPSGTGTNALG